MEKDSLAVLKFVAIVAIIVILLIVWFKTIGAPAGEEEEEVAEIITGCIQMAVSGTPVL